MVLIMLQRIAKFIARNTDYSRRKAEKLIAEGKVKVNNQYINTPCCFVNKKDIVEVDKKRVKVSSKTLLYLYYKPKGVICSSEDEKNRPIIYDNLPSDLRHLYYIGRLDFNSEGLLLLTNDGDLSHSLTSKDDIVKYYKVRVRGFITQAQLDSLAYGITIQGVHYKPIVANITSSKNHKFWLEFKMIEGKNNQIRKICEHFSLQVSRLIRVGYGPYQLLDMQISELREAKLEVLKKAILI